MRMFIEAVLEPSALDDVWANGQRLRAALDSHADVVRWVKREALHLTLRFLGEQEEARVPELVAALAEMEGSGRFDLHLDELGTFGGRRPRVIWTGFSEDDGYDRLQSMRQHLDSALNGAGFEPDRGAYRPHLTLGRVRRRASEADLRQIRAAVQSASPVDVRSSVQQVALVHSTLLKDGPRYRRLAVAEL